MAKVKTSEKLVLLGLSVCFLVALNILPDLNSKRPEEEQVTVERHRNVVSGRLSMVEVVRCRICGQVISRIEFDDHGRPFAGYDRASHECGKKWGKLSVLPMTPNRQIGRQIQKFLSSTSMR
jgi:hypothetical protein